MRERACTQLTHVEAIEAETIQRFGLTYIVLRCTVCNRPQGERLVRKNKA